MLGQSSAVGSVEYTPFEPPLKTEGTFVTPMCDFHVRSPNIIEGCNTRLDPNASAPTSNNNHENHENQQPTYLPSVQKYRDYIYHFGVRAAVCKGLRRSHVR